MYDIISYLKIYHTHEDCVVISLFYLSIMRLLVRSSTNFTTLSLNKFIIHNDIQIQNFNKH